MTKELTGKQLVVLHLQSVEEMKAGKTARSTKVDMLHRRSTVKKRGFLKATSHPCWSVSAHRVRLGSGPQRAQ